ncbi:hypothetical protein CONPUDRAFT_91401 [Coniophora puteana RWD-64-598 SS2]|uniref:Uncharacterized protein n=1 Tax=Coniophora puteana (strain RWD-64-598) TaxID=741705 RepID=A0A5M3MKA7_CONPW|nr:uncharacterized protein CONPUDRAFT_91401 [Coniophora puteana RWD-64-598 SS2]EIW79085.1 hypothetical protein CONPUDRAFT_91401 [Coniophora puteana RWD-64-598 SS2]
MQALQLISVSQILPASLPLRFALRATLLQVHGLWWFRSVFPHSHPPVVQKYH